MLQHIPVFLSRSMEITSYCAGVCGWLDHCWRWRGWDLEDNGKSLCSIPNEGAWGDQALSWAWDWQYKKGLFLCQKKYASNFLLKYGMFSCKPIFILIETNIKLCANEGKILKILPCIDVWLEALSIWPWQDIAFEVGGWVVICRSQRRLTWKQCN